GTHAGGTGPRNAVPDGSRTPVAAPRTPDRRSHQASAGHDDVLHRGGTTGTCLPPPGPPTTLCGMLGGDPGGRPRAHLSEAGEPQSVRYEKKIFDYPGRPAASRSEPLQVNRRGCRRTGRRGQDGDEVPAPADQVLIGWTVLAIDLGAEPAARSGRGVELDPGGVDVEFHGDPGAAAGQYLRQVGGDGGHARGVDKITGGVLAQGAAGYIRAAAQGGSPQAPVVGRGGGLAVQDQRLQVLPDAVDRLARRGRTMPPDPDAGPAG